MTVEVWAPAPDRFTRGDRFHALVFSDLLDANSTERFIFEPRGSFKRTRNDSALITGTLIRRQDGNTLPRQSFNARIRLIDREDEPPPGSPYLQLKPRAYVDQGGPVDPAHWWYYTTITGRLTGKLDFDGAVIRLTRRGPAFQIGFGASGKNACFGGSCWFNYRVTKQPSTGVELATTGKGDVNVQIGVTVKTQGFWKRVCARRHPSGEHERIEGYVDLVNQTSTFADVDDRDALCERLHPDPKNDKCEQAEAQFMALLLNLHSKRLSLATRVEVADLGQTTISEVVAHIDGLLSNPDRTRRDCTKAQGIADSINRGASILECP